MARRIVAACGRDLRSADRRRGAAARARSGATSSTRGSACRPCSDILAELEKPGRDPRPAFMTATFQEGVEEISDLKPGMLLEGTVTNVAAFGAFVDIGVHQDGLVHVSQLADRFVKDPHEVVKAGDVVKVRVVEVDVPRKRIGLSMRKDGGGRDAAAKPADRGRRPRARLRAGARPSRGPNRGPRPGASAPPCRRR